MPVISASRRTDIPACHFGWFMDRLRAGSADIPNPRNPGMIRHVDLSPAGTAAIVFWTKNPVPMEPEVMDPSSLLNRYPYYIQFTLTPYGRDLEPGLPEKAELVRVFNRFSERLGIHRMVWRYDPILISPACGVGFHREQFREFAGKLRGCTDTCVISFLDEYSCMRKAMRKLGARPPTEAEAYAIAESMAADAAEYGIRLQTCSEAMDLSGLGIPHGACIDAERIRRIISEKWEKTGEDQRGAVSAPGTQLSLFPEIPLLKRAKGQRSACLCAESVDIGTYGTCGIGCVYCYASHR